VLGAGVGSSIPFVKAIWDGVSHPHNDYLRIGFELGLVGLAIFLVAIAVQLVDLVKLAKKTEGAIQQDCVLTWAVPCDATASSLKNEIKIAARTTIDGQPTDEESHVLKTIEGKKGSACSVPAKTSVKKEKKP